MSNSKADKSATSRKSSTTGDGAADNVSPVRMNRSDAVRAAAIDIFFAKGYAATSIRDIAEAAGVLKGSLYHYISSKEDVLYEIIADSHRGRGRYNEIAVMDAPAIERLTELIRTSIEWYLEYYKVAAIFTREWRYLEGPRWAEIRHWERGWDKFMLDLIEEAQGDRAIPEHNDPVLLRFYMVGAMNSIPEWYRPTGRLDARAIIDSYTQFTMAVLQSPALEAPSGA